MLCIAILPCSVKPVNQGGWGYSPATRDRKIGRNPDSISFHTSIFMKVLQNWPAWAEAEHKAGRLSLPRRLLVQQFLVSACTYHTATIGDVKYQTWKHGDMQVRRPNRGCCWVVLHKRYTPQELADQEQPVFGRIKKIYTHKCTALTEGKVGPQVKPNLMLGVEWFTTPTAGRVYDTDLDVPVIGATPSTTLANQLPKTFPGALIVPLHIIVMPHPKRNDRQVLLPANNDFYWLECAGFRGPNL